MKRIALVGVFLAATVGAGYAALPNELGHYSRAAAEAMSRAWESVEANPVPVYLALGTFLLTVVYHKAKGKSLRESVEVAATRVTVVPVPPPRELSGDETAVVKRAKARATRTQLLTDQIALQNRYRKLPEEVQRAEKEACYTEQALADAERLLTEKQKAHDEAAGRLESLRKAKAQVDSELGEIEAELKKLAELV